MNEPLRTGFVEPEAPLRAKRLAPLMVMAGSLVTLLPGVATVPWLPPFGLMLLIAWRLLRTDLLRIWAAAPLGLFDDLVSGQPIGSATMLWTMCILAIDMLDTRLVWRDFWQDWLLATGAIGFCLIAGRLVASPLSAHVDTALVLQIALSASAYPLIARMCAAIDLKARA
ncbi:rod shape-determining protein MreD [Sphingomonas baiyangensis]|uniref:Rod shape-determining protein MreD n=1 Tax=Sphingomonas baiyangensis TaxID=2572576 RepID=A0A4U1L2A3_9SPHN|nr:rod shape-determining protein MreD [Sphingomonas baiyangensis]TKD50146.1 rod shape-determining protein MreD [Sphingomonas baiyangensis]